MQKNEKRSQETIPTETVGSRIGKHLEENRITKKELSDSSGLSLSCVRNICNGKTKHIRCITYYRICKALNMSANYFLFG